MQARPGQASTNEASMRDNPSDHDRLTTDAGKIPGTKWVTAFDAVAEAARFPAENPNPVFRVASDGRLLYANQASRQLMSAWYVADNGRVPPLWRERVASVLAAGETRKWDEECGERTFQLTCVPIRDSGYVNVYGADLTDRIALENQLRLSEATAKDLIRHAPTGIYEVDFHTGRLRTVNDAMCEILGYTREELFAMSAFDLLDGEGKVLFAERIRHTLASEPVDPSVEYRVIKKDGGVIFAVLSARITYRNGRPDGAFVIAHDITERRRAADELARQREQLQEARDLLEQRVEERTAELQSSQEQLRTLSRRLVAMQEAERSYVADQLYNQAGQVLAALQMQLSRFEREEWQDCPAELVPTMQATLSEAMRELHGLAMQLRPVGLDRSPLAGVLRAYVTEFGKANGLLVRVCPGNADSLRVRADIATALYRSIQEGLSNVAGHAQASEITLSVSGDDERLAVVLADNGRGFEPESAVAAAGPGLASIRERLETVGGQLKVASGAEGTTLYMQVPLNREEQQV